MQCSTLYIYSTRGTKLHQFEPVEKNTRKFTVQVELKYPDQITDKTGDCLYRLYLLIPASS